MNVARCSSLVLTLMLMSCSNSSDPTQTQIIDRSGFTVGSISGFGSVIVNGVRFDTQNATFLVDDQSATEEVLEIGQIVLIIGSVDPDGTTGTADTVETDPTLRGIIDSIDLGASSLAMLGTTVMIDANTLFASDIEPNGLSGLLPGERIEVFGFPNASGAVVATLIRNTDDTGTEIRGVVAALDADNGRFQINDLTIDFSNAAIVDDNNAANGAIADGVLVEVEGTDFDNGALVADRVEIPSAFSADDEGAEVELSGIVTRFASATDFDLGGVRITTDAQTQFEDGDLGDLALNIRIEVEGTLNAQGVVVAEEIEFEAESNLEAESLVEAIDVDAQTVTVLGLVLTATPKTQFVDDSDADLSSFSLADVVVGDYVKIKAADSTLELDLFKRKNPEDEEKLKGIVTRIEDPMLFIGAARIDTNAATEFESETGAMTAAEFFAALSIGTRVEAEGQNDQAGVLTAESIEIE